MDDDERQLHRGRPRIGSSRADGAAPRGPFAMELSLVAAERRAGVGGEPGAEPPELVAVPSLGEGIRPFVVPSSKAVNNDLIKRRRFKLQLLRRPRRQLRRYRESARAEQSSRRR